MTDLCADLLGPEIASIGTRPSTRSPAPTYHVPMAPGQWLRLCQEPQQYLTCWIASTHTDEDNGCPWVVPGRPHDGDARPRGDRRGVWSASTRSSGRGTGPRVGGAASSSSHRSPPTGTGPNITDGVRKAYIVQYAPERRRGDPVRARRVLRPGSGPTTRHASTRSCAPVLRVTP